MPDRDAYPSEKADKYLLRLPDGMRDKLKESAKKSNRTMNAEIVARLEASFSDKENHLSTVVAAEVSRQFDEYLGPIKAFIDSTEGLREEITNVKKERK